MKNDVASRWEVLSSRCFVSDHSFRFLWLSVHHSGDAVPVILQTPKWSSMSNPTYIILLLLLLSLPFDLSRHYGSLRLPVLFLLTVLILHGGSRSSPWLSSGVPSASSTLLHASPRSFLNTPVVSLRLWSFTSYFLLLTLCIRNCFFIYLWESGGGWIY